MNTFQQLRRSKGFSIPQLAVSAEISTSSVYRLEHDKPVSLLTAGRACQALGLSIDPNKPAADEFKRYGIVLTENEHQRNRR